MTEIPVGIPIKYLRHANPIQGRESVWLKGVNIIGRVSKIATAKQTKPNEDH